MSKGNKIYRKKETITKGEIIGFAEENSKNGNVLMRFFGADPPKKKNKRGQGVTIEDRKEGENYFQSKEAIAFRSGDIKLIPQEDGTLRIV